MGNSIKQTIYFSVINLRDSILYRNKLLPPAQIRGLINNPDEFGKVGQEFLAYFKDWVQLSSESSVLDVGCGNGRMAIPLTQFLDNKGSYEGFDIIPECVDWCAKTITPKFPNFNFKLANVYNQRYYPQGKIKAAEYTFPYEDGSFDFIYLTSVFTHMLPIEMERYFSEISRVLKKGGKSLITFFLLNPESIRLIENQASNFTFQHKFENYRLEDKNEPEAAIAYNEDFIEGLYKKYKLNIDRPIKYGSWCKRENPCSFQDLILAIK